MNPLDKMIVTSPFGPRVHPINKNMSFHSGVDLKANYEKAYAKADGVVRIAKTSRYPIGTYIVIDHKDCTTVYGHMDSWAFEAGERVNEGDCIGITGNSGASTAPHLHFEIRKGNPKTLWSKTTSGKYNLALDPMSYLKEEKPDLKELIKQVEGILIEMEELL